MRIAGVLQNYNNLANGFLRQALNSLGRVCDVVCVYDDGSTEDVRPLYLEYDCVVLFGQVNSFKYELAHKQQLLKIVLMEQPDFCCWHDTDAVLGRHFESRERTEKVLLNMATQQIDLLHNHNLNLWRSPWWYRVDQSFDGLDHGVWWRNSGEMFYSPIAKLHQKQYPQFWRDPKRPIIASKFDQPDGQLLHFGFASEIEIARKYFTYRQHGQTGWALDRLVDESTLELKPALKEWFPEWLLSTLGEPGAAPVPYFSPVQMAEFKGFEEWLGSYRGGNRQ